MLDIMTNPILGGGLIIFAIGIGFTIWSEVDDWMWERKNK